VNEMAYNISKKLGRGRCGWSEEDATSVRSDETDFSDVSCGTTYSAPAAGSSDRPDGKSPYPNFAKYAKYFEREKDGSSETSTPTSAPNRWSERRRVAISSSFQHRRRRVHTPSPAAFDDSTKPSRCESAPHLASDGVSYRPTVRPRQGSSIASPLLRRARPASCIIEELADDKELFNHIDERAKSSETERRAASTERHRQPPFREHVVLPTHRENISMDEDRRSVPAQEESTRHARQPSKDVKAGSTWSRTTPGQDEPSRHSKHHSETFEAGKSSRIPSRAELSRNHRHHSDYLETGVTSNNSTPVNSQPDKHGSHHSNNFEANSTTFTATPGHTEPARNTKSHSDNVKTGKSSSSLSSRLGRRVLPDVPTVSSASPGSAGHGSGVRSETGASDVHHSRRLPNVDKFKSTERHHATGVARQQKDTDMSKPSRANISDSNKVKSPGLSDPNKPLFSYSSASTKFTETPKQKTPSSKPASNVDSSGPAGVKSSLSSSAQTKPSTSLDSSGPAGVKSSLSSSSQTKPSASMYSSGPAGVKSSSSSSAQTKPSASAKLHDVDPSKSSVSGTKSSARESLASQKAQESRKSSADPNASQSKSATMSSKVQGSEQVKYLQRAGQTTPESRGSKSTHKDERPRAGVGQQKRQSESSTGAEQSPSPNKSRSSKSTPGSGSRLTYKVNASTIGPVLMNRKKMKPNSPDTGQRSSVETTAGDDVGATSPHGEETMLSDDIKMQERVDDVAASGRHSSKSGGHETSATSNVSQRNSANDGNCRQGPSVDKDCDDNARTSVPNTGSSHLSQTDVNADNRSAANKCNTDNHFPQTPRAAADDQTHTAADSATDADVASGNRDAKNDKKKQQQWQDFMATLQAARAKYSTTDHRSLTSETTRVPPVYSDSITPRWRIHRDDFAVPTSIAFASDGSAVIADVANCLLDFADVDGNVVHSVTGTKPFSVAVGCDDNIYVGDRRSRTVRVFDTYGGDVAQWDSESAGFGWIAGIAKLRNGQLAIVDRERCKVGSRSFLSGHQQYCLALHCG